VAGLLLVQLKEDLNLKVGVWDALADGGSWGFSGNEVVILFGALDYTYALGDGRFAGAWEIGAAYFSGGDVSGGTLPSAHGYYVQLEQLIYRENVCDDADAQGLGIFVSYFQAFSSGVIPAAAIGDDFLAGIVYRGLVPGRDEDVVGAGVAWAELFQGGTDQETVVEIFYKARITPWLSLQPDLQYIASPSGIHRDVLTAGLLMFGQQLAVLVLGFRNVRQRPHILPRRPAVLACLRAGDARPHRQAGGSTHRQAAPGFALRPVVKEHRPDA